MFEDVTKAINDLTTYLKQKEVRDAIGSDEAFNKFGNHRLIRMRYENALKSGEDRELVEALESSPIPYKFVARELERKAQQGEG